MQLKYKILEWEWESYHPYSLDDSFILFLHGWSSKCSYPWPAIPGRSWNMTACPAFCRKIMCVDSGIWPGSVKGDLSLGPVNFSNKSTRTSLGVSEGGVKVNLNDRGDPKPTLDLNLILILPICFEHTWKTWVDDILWWLKVWIPQASQCTVFDNVWEYSVQLRQVTHP